MIDNNQSIDPKYPAYLSSVMKIPDSCICLNKGADQLHINRAAD